MYLPDVWKHLGSIINFITEQCIVTERLFFQICNCWDGSISNCQYHIVTEPPEKPRLSWAPETQGMPLKEGGPLAVVCIVDSGNKYITMHLFGDNYTDGDGYQDDCYDDKNYSESLIVT